MKPLLNLTIAQFMERTVTQWPGRTALTFKWQALDLPGAGPADGPIAAGLMAGVRRGNHVAILRKYSKRRILFSGNRESRLCILYAEYRLKSRRAGGADGPVGCPLPDDRKRLQRRGFL